MTSNASTRSIHARPVLSMPVRDAEDAPGWPDQFSWRPTPDHEARAIRRLRTSLDLAAQSGGLTWRELLVVMLGDGADRVAAAVESCGFGPMDTTDVARLCCSALQAEADLG